MQRITRDRIHVQECDTLGYMGYWDHSVLTVVAPQSGRNLIIVDPDGLELDEIERHTCTLQGLPG